MKRLLVISFLFGLALPSLAQNSNWSVGLGVTPQWDAISTTLYANRHLGERWQIGLMPIGRWKKYEHDTYTANDNWLGINLNTRFHIVKDGLLTPYLYGFGGYINHEIKISDSSGKRNYKYDYLNFSAGGGTLINIGSKGWSIDVNVGYFWLHGYENGARFNDYFYSFGVFKRF